MKNFQDSHNAIYGNVQCLNKNRPISKINQVLNINNYFLDDDSNLMVSLKADSQVSSKANFDLNNDEKADFVISVLEQILNEQK